MYSDEGFEDVPLTILAETDNFAIVMGEDLEGEVVYNIELGSVSIHLFQEEWDEFASLIAKAKDMQS